MYVSVKSLPQQVQHILIDASKYGRSDIRVTHTNSVSLGNSGPGDGYRAFTILLNLETGEYKKFNGSWGGINMFNLDNPVDTDDSVYQMVPGALVIKGWIGGGNPTHAEIYAHQDSSILPLTSSAETTRQELITLYCHHRIKGGTYRKEELYRQNVSKSDIENAVAKGWIKVNKAGSAQITTEGKNALGTFGQNGFVPQS